MDFWHHVLSSVEKHMSRQCFDTWFRPIVYQGRESGVLRVMVPTESFKKCLLENYSSLLLDAAGEIAHSSLSLSISVEAALSPESAQPAVAAADATDSSAHLIPKYTFDTFVVGSSNQL